MKYCPNQTSGNVHEISIMTRRYLMTNGIILVVIMILVILHLVS
jgi:hypothetical protein